MRVQSIHDFTGWFDTVLTTPRSQVAMMRLAPGKETGPRAESHPRSDQVLLVLEGAVDGEVDGSPVSLSKDQFLVIPAGTPHRFYNPHSKPALTFNVYALPAYPAETQE